MVKRCDEICGVERDVAVRTLKALSRSITYYQDPANKQRVVTILSKWLRLQRTEDAVAGYDAVRNLHSRRIFPTVDGARNTLRILDRVDPKFGRMKAENLVNERIVRKLERDVIVSPIAVVPRTAVHVDDGRKRSRSFGLINASQPRLACQRLILDIPHIYFVFDVTDHGGNRQPRRVALQIPQTAAK